MHGKIAGPRKPSGWHHINSCNNPNLAYGSLASQQLFIQASYKCQYIQVDRAIFFPCGTQKCCGLDLREPVIGTMRGRSILAIAIIAVLGVAAERYELFPFKLVRAGYS